VARRPPIVTLTTDLGSAYAAQMKAVLYQTLPPGHVVDLVDDLSAHRIEEAAFLLDHLARGFPKGTIHIAVVDPGVGGDRAPVVVVCAEGSLLVGPDNGLLSPLANHLGISRAFRLLPERVRPGGPVSPTFEGRDLFAPAAALLADGTEPKRLGPPARLHAYAVPTATMHLNRAVGQVLHIDRFGNAITNVPSDWAPPGGSLELRFARRSRVVPRRRTYADLLPGGLGVVGSSFGTLEVCAREARASDVLGLRVGQRVEMRRGWRATRR
jgi:S-adenosyl-L-methionine hydrolase (adenosine-forming)